jgi:glutamine amidotransferase
MSSSVAVIDYGMGNLHSVAKALEHVGDNVTVHVTSDAQQIKNADRVVFPGVGAIRDCMKGILDLKVNELIVEAVQEKPVLAICVGMQALMDSSEENDGTDCLAMVPGEVKYFGESLKDDRGEKLKVPHMGWNTLNQSVDHPMWAGIDQDAYFYFVHSYYVKAANPDVVAAKVNYGVEFDAALFGKNIFATQFHPEKSHNNGLQLLKNFVEWQGAC